MTREGDGQQPTTLAMAPGRYCREAVNMFVASAGQA